MLYAIVTGTFLFTVLLMSQLYEIVTWKQRKLERRLKSVTKQPSRPNPARFLPREFKGKWFKAATIPGSLFGRRYLDKLQSVLVKAGLPLKPEEMISFTLLSGIVLALLGTIAANIVAGAVLGILGLTGPVIWVSYLLNNRIKRLELQLLDAVVLMANSLRGGHSFMQALELVSRESPPPLSEELNRVVRETKVGISTEDALNNLRNRVKSPDLDMVITGVLLQRQIGGNLAQILDAVADTIDKRIRMRGKIKTLTAQGRLSAWVVSLLPFGLGIVVFGRYPEFGRIMLEEPLGLAMLGIGAVSLTIGIMLIRKVVNIDA